MTKAKLFSTASHRSISTLSNAGGEGKTTAALLAEAALDLLGRPPHLVDIDQGMGSLTHQREEAKSLDWGMPQEKADTVFSRLRDRDVVFDFGANLLASGAPVVRLFHDVNDKLADVGFPRDHHPSTNVVAYDLETVVDHEPADGSFPPIPEHRPVAGAFLRARWAAGDRYSFRLDVPVCALGGEGVFYDTVNTCLTGAVGVGFNSRGFDNPVLRNQCMAHRQFSWKAIAQQTQAGRYDAVHCDLADQLASYGSSRTPSLAAICKALAIPVKTSVHGSDVGTLWHAGDIEAIKRYVAEDAVATYLVWLHWLAWRDSDSAQIVLPLSDLAIWIEQTPELEHLRSFAKCPPARWARSQAPALRAEIAEKDAERRLTRERDEAAFSA